MHRARNPAAVRDRALWLSELAQAIAQAQKVSWTLGVAEGDSEEARTLYSRLESLRAEVDELRYGDWAIGWNEIDPKWIHGLNGAHVLIDPQDA